MQKWGKTPSRHIRWRCSFCKKNSIRVRKDITLAALKKTFTNWLLHTNSKSEIAQSQHVHRRTLTRRFMSLWGDIPTPAPSHRQIPILIIDGIYLESRDSCVLIGRTKTNIVSWMFAHHESYISWKQFFSSIPQPSYVVCDGQRGMQAALAETWPQTHIQRCMFHVIQHAHTRLTQSQKTHAGKHLQKLIHILPTVWTRRQKRRWIWSYKRWKKTYASFLSEKTYETKQNGKRTWWYTHRMLRALRSLLDHALPELFTYIGHYEIPRTTNYVEGGINSRLAELLHRHRGFSLSQKKCMVATYLSQKQVQKPTRNVP